MAGHVPGRQRRLHRRSRSARSWSSRSRSLGSLTVLPARARRCSARDRAGPHARSSPRAPARTRLAASGARSLDRVLRRPRSALALAAAVLLALALPALGMHTLNPGVARPAARRCRHADLRPHPGRVPRRPDARDVVVVTAPRPDGAAVARPARGHARRARATGPCPAPVTSTSAPTSTVAVVAIPLAGRRHRPPRCRAGRAARPRRSRPRSGGCRAARPRGRRDRRVARLQRRYEAAPPIVFAFVLGAGVRAAAA